MRPHASVVVIGGGAVGASCLYHLGRAGVNDCLLIEKDELTSGSTWHAAGNIPTYANSWLGMRAGNYAWQIYKELSAEAASPITYRHTGAFWPAQTLDRMDLFRHLVGVSKSVGFELAMLSPGDMEAMHPYYQAGKTVLGGIYDPYEGDIDPGQLTQALATGARNAGAEVARFTRVTGIERTVSREWNVITDKGEVTCETIVNAAGFYGSQIAGMVGQTLPTATLEHQYVVTEALQPLEQNATIFPLIRDPDIRFYLRRERASFLFGSYAHPGRLAFKDGIPEQFAHELFNDSVDDIVDLFKHAVEQVPLLAEAGIQRFVNGPIAYSPDAMPMCGPAYGLPNFYHACGIQIGITHSAAVGKAICEWITQGESEWDYSAWDPRRFGDWATPEYTQQRTVQLYDLQYAIPFPHRILQSGRPVQTTPLYDKLKEQGAVFGQIGGWERAFWFDCTNGNDPDILSFRASEPWRAAVQTECETVRDGVGVMDHGGFTKYEVSGAGATDFLNKVFCSRLPGIGRVRLAYMLTPGGKIWSEAIIARFDDNRYLLCGPTLADNRDYDWLSSHLPTDGGVNLHKGSERDAALMIMGPKSRVLLSTLGEHDLSILSMPWMFVGEISLAGCKMTAMRVSYVGELGWELHLQSADLRKVYAAICSAGEEFGLVNFGSYALNSMRLEKAYPGWGADFGTEYTMFDAGLQSFIDFDRTDFIGSDAAECQRRTDAKWRLVRLTVNIKDAEPLPSDPIILDGKCVGYVTSGAMGYRIGKCIALGYVQGSVSKESRELHIEILGESISATVSETVFYDPGNSRPKS